MSMSPMDGANAPHKPTLMYSVVVIVVVVVVYHMISKRK